MADVNLYILSRRWFNWCFENPELISPNHTAIYFFAVEHCNRLGWKDKFGFPTQMTMDAIGIKKHQTYIKYFNNLVEWGFIELIQKSVNQYSSNIISIKTAMPKTGTALDKAFITHAAKQTEPIWQSNSQSNSSIDIQEYNTTNIPINQSTNLHDANIHSQDFDDSEKIKIVDTCYKDCISLYNDFILTRTSLPAKIDGAQGKAMKSIISYFKSIETVKSGERTVQECVSFIFNNWDRVEPFLKDKLKLTQINSDLTNIINQLKNGKSTNNGKSKHELAEAIRQSNADIAAKYARK